MFERGAAAPFARHGWTTPRPEPVLREAPDPHRGIALGIEHELGVAVSGVQRPPLTVDLPAVFLRAAGVEVHGPASGQFLANGARLYLDSGEHPEYASPECSTPGELVAADAASMELLGAAARRAEAELRTACGPLRLHVIRNNVSPTGSCWGTHENYLVSAALSWAELLGPLAGHLASRVCMVAPGTVLGGPAGGAWTDGKFRLSQRAPFTGLLAAASASTNLGKPMVLTRDEPLADATRYRRLQVLCGDANMAQTSSLLKVGTTVIAIRLIETGTAPAIQLDDPVEAFRTFAADPDLRATAPTNRGRRRALDVQGHWLEAARRHHDRFGLPDGEAAVLPVWEEVLDGLRNDPDRLSDRLDWVAKRRMLGALGDRHRLRAGDPHLAAADLAYHDLHPDRSLYLRLVSSGRMRQIADAAEVRLRCSRPPDTTRAAARGALVRALRASGRRYDVSWTGCRLDPGACDREVRLPDPLDPFPAVARELLAELGG